MDSRRETRQEIYTAAKLTLLENPQRDEDCSVLDISGAGIKFIASENLQTDEMIILEIEDHLVLADVRYSEPRGDKYVVGAERIHALKKSSLAPGQEKAAQIQFVVNDYRARIRSAVVHPYSQPDIAGPYRDQIVGAAVQQLLRQWAKESEESRPDGSLRAAIVERQSR